MLRPLQTFLKNPAPTRAEAAGALRTLFALAFGGQALLAGLAWVVMSLVLEPDPTGPLTAQVLVGLGALELPIALALGTLTARGKKQPGALAAALLEGVLLATPLLYALFAWLIGSPALYPVLLAGLAALFYGVGVLTVARHAVGAVQTSQTPHQTPQQAPKTPQT